MLICKYVFQDFIAILNKVYLIMTMLITFIKRITIGIKMVIELKLIWYIWFTGVLHREVVMQLKQTLFLQIFGLVAFIEQKENDNNDNLCKIHVGLCIASALID